VQLLVEGSSLLEADGVVLVVAGASDRHCLSLDLGMEPNELERVAFNGTRMGRYLGCELVGLTTLSLSASVWCKRMLFWRLCARPLVGYACHCVVCDGVDFGWLWQMELVLIGN
jgi:hypothetical protein